MFLSLVIKLQGYKILKLELKLHFHTVCLMAFSGLSQSSSNGMKMRPVAEWPVTGLKSNDPM